MTTKGCNFWRQQIIKRNAEWIDQRYTRTFCVGSFTDANNAIQKIQRNLPDVILMDIEMPGINGIEAVKIIKQHYPKILIIMQTVLKTMIIFSTRFVQALRVIYYWRRLLLHVYLKQFRKPVWEDHRWVHLWREKCWRNFQCSNLQSQNRNSIYLTVKKKFCNTWWKVWATKWLPTPVLWALIP